MRKLLLEVELEYDDDIMHSPERNGLTWFHDEVLLGSASDLSLHSGYVGDFVGSVRVIAIRLAKRLN